LYSLNVLLKLYTLCIAVHLEYELLLQWLLASPLDRVEVHPPIASPAANKIENKYNVRAFNFSVGCTANRRAGIVLNCTPNWKEFHGSS
jgi:hypothetical protein